MCCGRGRDRRVHDAERVCGVTAEAALLAAIERLAPECEKPESILTLAQAYALIQPDEPDEDTSVYSVGDATMLRVEDGWGLVDRGGIGFTPRAS